MHPSKIPLTLLGIYAVLFAVLAVEPYDRATWWAENMPILIAVFILIITYVRFQFSNFAYVLMSVFFFYHTIGGYWTFELVPFDQGNAVLAKLNWAFIFPDERNNFDRLGHFLVGVFAYPAVELSVRKQWINNRLITWCFAVFALGFWAASYEIIEMAYAVIEGGESGAAFLGAQGDIWDAQKDMLLDIVGATVFALLAIIICRRKI